MSSDAAQSTVSGEPVSGESVSGSGMRRRSYALSLVASLAGAGLACYAVTRTWSIELTPRTGMSDLRTVHTGTDLEPFVLGLAVVALAGTGALLATHGWLRRALGVLLTLAGLGVLAGSIAGRIGLDPGAAGGRGAFWPVLSALGGVIAALGGLIAVRDGHRWPRMSSRYERKPVAPAQLKRPKRSDPLQPADHRAAWDALDRGDDPTA